MESRVIIVGVFTFVEDISYGAPRYMLTIVLLYFNLLLYERHIQAHSKPMFLYLLEYNYKKKWATSGNIFSHICDYRHKYQIHCILVE